MRNSFNPENLVDEVNTLKNDSKDSTSPAAVLCGISSLVVACLFT